MAKSGLLVLLANVILKAIVGFGLWRMAMAYNAPNTVDQEFVVDAGPAVENYVPEQQRGRIYMETNAMPPKTQIRSDSYSNGDV